jgi:hypothetical protein
MVKTVQIPCNEGISVYKYIYIQQYVFMFIKPGYAFQLYCHHQAYLQSLVKVYMLNAYATWDPSSEAKSYIWN